MRNCCLLIPALALLLAACTGEKRIVAEPPAADDLHLTWELISNRVASYPRYRSAFTLENRGERPLGNQGWAIYFNQITRRIIPGSVRGPAVVEQLNGDFYRFRPTEDFLLLPGQRLTITFDAEDWIIKMLDGPTGVYIAFSGEKGRTEQAFPLKHFQIKPFTRPEQSTRFSSDMDHAPLPDPDWRYAQYGDLVLLSAEALPPLLPTPKSTVMREGKVRLDDRYRIYCHGELRHEASYLAAMLGQVLPETPEWSEAVPSGETNAIQLSLDKTIAGGPEAYSLELDEGRIDIRGASSAGVFYGVQSLLALLPPRAWAAPAAAWELPALRLDDAPRFPYRGMHLDVARNFNGVAAVKKMLDAMAFYKLNRLQMRLTDDEGWRLEIEELPELTEVGAFRGHPAGGKDLLPPAFGSGPYPDPEQGSGSGFFSREQFRELIRYAHERHIELIPEICVPSHARAAIVAMEVRYRRLMEQGREAAAREYLLTDFEDASEYRSAQHYTDNIICVCRESAVRFYETVVDDILEIYQEAGVPLRTFHVGGDEVPGGAWSDSPVCREFLRERADLRAPDDLFFYYRRRIFDLLEARGLTIGGWEEVVLRKAAAEQYVPDDEQLDRPIRAYVWNNLWGNQDLGYRLANAGYEVVLSNVTNFYFDLAYTKEPEEPGLYWGGFSSTRQAFEFNPFDVFRSTTTDDMGKRLDPAGFRDQERLLPAARSRIQGLQGQLWSETIKGPAMLEYYYLPKMLGLAERAWAPAPVREAIDDSGAYERQLATDWNLFANTLGQRELPRLDYLFGGYNYRLAPPGVRIIGGRLHVNAAFPGALLRYRINKGAPEEYTGPVPVTGLVSVTTVDSRGRESRPSSVMAD